MQCFSCQAALSPAFVSAIRENRCPACGNACLDPDEYRRVFVLVRNLQVLDVGFDDATFIKLAAAINEKFDIFPKGAVKDGYVDASIGFQEPAPVRQAIGRIAQPANPRMRTVKTATPAEAAAARMAKIQQAVKEAEAESRSEASDRTQSGRITAEDDIDDDFVDEDMPLSTKSYEGITPNPQQVSILSEMLSPVTSTDIEREAERLTRARMSLDKGGAGIRPISRKS